MESYSSIKILLHKPGKTSLRTSGPIKMESRGNSKTISTLSANISKYYPSTSVNLVHSDTKSKDFASTTPHPTREWSRTEEIYNSVTQDSALPNLPLRLELPIPSESDHSNMTKFYYKDSTYSVLVRELKNVILRSISKALPRIYPQANMSQSHRSDLLLDFIAILRRIQTQNQLAPKMVFILLTR